MQLLMQIVEILILLALLSEISLMIYWRIQDRPVQEAMIRLLSEQKEVLEDSQAELADIRDAAVEGEHDGSGPKE